MARYFEVTNEITGELCVVAASGSDMAKMAARHEFITAGIPAEQIDTARMAVAEISAEDYDQWYGN